MKTVLRGISYCIAALGILGASALLLPGVATADPGATPCAGCVQTPGSGQTDSR